MKKIVLLLALATLSGLVNAQKSEVRSVGTFSGVSASEGIVVFLKKGNTESVKVEVGDNMELSRVVTQVSGTYLKIHMSSGHYKGNVSAKVYVTYVSLTKIIASSAANIYSEGTLKSDKLELSASSASSMELKIEVGTLVGTISSAGDMELEGKAKQATFEVSSAAKLDAYDLEVESLSIEASSAGSAKVSVVSDFRAEASSGADIKYKGSPAKSRTNSSSGGSVKKSY